MTPLLEIAVVNLLARIFAAHSKHLFHIVKYFTALIRCLFGIALYGRP